MWGGKQGDWRKRKWERFYVLLPSNQHCSIWGDVAILLQRPDYTVSGASDCPTHTHTISVQIDFHWDYFSYKYVLKQTDVCVCVCLCVCARMKWSMLDTDQTHRDHLAVISLWLCVQLLLHSYRRVRVDRHLCVPVLNVCHSRLAICCLLCLFMSISTALPDLLYCGLTICLKNNWRQFNKEIHPKRMKRRERKTVGPKSSPKKKKSNKIYFNFRIWKTWRNYVHNRCSYQCQNVWDG